MKVISCFLVTLGISAVYLSQDIGGTSKNLYENLVEQTTERLEDFDEPKSRYNCYIEYEHCDPKLYYNSKPICVYKKKLGLTNFYGMCTIKLQYCLMAHPEKKQEDSDFPVSEQIYHNGKHFGCLYYFQRVESEQDGIIMYFNLGGLNAASEKITKP